MSKEDLRKIVNYVVKQGIATLANNTNERSAVIDYVAIFSKDENEFKDLNLVADSIGKEVDKENAKSGKTFLLGDSLETPAGSLNLLKIRKPDATRPQRGAPDFKIRSYWQFKKKYLKTSGNFALMIRKGYEMIEIKGVDVLVYIPNKPLSGRLKREA